MSDQSIVHIGENSPQQVAFKLLQAVATVERKSLSGAEGSELKQGWTKADRAWLLDTYSECLQAVHAGRPVRS